MGDIAVNTLAKPAMRPARAEFSSGPCAKRPGWSPEALRTAVLGRSHRSKLGKARLQAAIDQTRTVLQVPADYLIGIVPASDTGAVEMALWSMLGPRPVQLLAFESFGKDWVTDVVKLPNGDFIAADRQGVVICDATSACFAQTLDWAKLDVVTFSWQKALGGEAAHGMLILSPRAVARIESYNPPWPMPKIFRLKKGDKLNTEIFEAATINTPSMLCVEDYLDTLKWAASIGGLTELKRRADENLQVLADWAAKTPWIGFLAEDPAIRSNTSVCLKVIAPQITALSDDAQADFAKRLAALLEREGVALDIGGYRDAPPGLRIWCGATVDAADLRALTPWLDWAFATLEAELSPA